MEITIPVTVTKGGRREGPFNTLIGATTEDATITLHIDESTREQLAQLLWQTPKP